MRSHKALAGLTLFIGTLAAPLTAHAASDPVLSIDQVTVDGPQIHVVWSTSLNAVTGYSVSLEHNSAVLDTQSVDATTNSADFFVMTGEGYDVVVSAEGGAGTLASVTSDTISVTSGLIPIDPTPRRFVPLDSASVSVALSDDGSSWVANFAALDQQGDAVIYSVYLDNGQVCSTYSSSDTQAGDALSCSVAVDGDTSVTPSVSSADYVTAYPYFVVDPVPPTIIPVDASSASIALSDDGSSWVVSFPAVDQQGLDGSYYVTLDNGTACSVSSNSDTAVGDVLGCTIDAAGDTSSTPTVSSIEFSSATPIAYMFNKGVVMRSADGAGDVTSTTVEGVVNATDDTSTVEPVATLYSEPVSASPDLKSPIVVALLGLIAAFAVLRPRRAPRSH